MLPVEFRDQENGQPCHKYYVDGKEVPGLSYMLSTSGFTRYGKVKESVMEAARERGDAAHFATRLYDEDNPLIADALKLDIWEREKLSEPLDDYTRSRLTGWIKFRVDFEFNPDLIEKPIAHTWNGMTYAMTLDRYGSKSAIGPLVTEIKCTAEIEPSHAIQTAFQIQPYKNGEPLRRVAVQLLENDYKIHQFEDRQDERIAQCILACTWWKWGQGIR